MGCVAKPACDILPQVVFPVVTAQQLRTTLLLKLLLVKSDKNNFKGHIGYSQKEGPAYQSWHEILINVRND
jgi:hypothetical protein